MALVDKHKVKRQRLDRICEGETPLFHSFPSLSLCAGGFTHGRINFTSDSYVIISTVFYGYTRNKVVVVPKEEHGLLLWSFTRPQLLLKMCQTGASHGASSDCVESQFHGGHVKSALLYRKRIWRNKSQAVLHHNANSPHYYLEAVFWPRREIEIKLHTAHIDKTTKTLSSESNCARWESPT